MIQSFHTPEVLIGYPKSNTGWRAQVMAESRATAQLKLHEDDILAEYSNVFRTGWQISFQHNGTPLVSHADCGMPVEIDANLLALFMTQHPGIEFSQVPLKICLLYTIDLLTPSYSLVSEEMLQAAALLPHWVQYLDHQFLPASQVKSGDIIKVSGSTYRLVNVLDPGNQATRLSYLVYSEDAPNKYRIFNVPRDSQVYRYAESPVSPLDLLVNNLATANQLTCEEVAVFRRAWNAVNLESLSSAMEHLQPLTCQYGGGTKHLVPLDLVFDNFTEEMLEQYFQKAKAMVISNDGSLVYSNLLKQSHHWHFEFSRARRKGYVKVGAPYFLYNAIYNTAQPDELTYAQAAMFLNAVKQHTWVALNHFNTLALSRVLREIAGHLPG